MYKLKNSLFMIKQFLTAGKLTAGSFALFPYLRSLAPHYFFSTMSPTL